ncbi:MAG: hypothetical protein ABIA78_01190 [archaeon]
MSLDELRVKITLGNHIKRKYHPEDFTIIVDNISKRENLMRVKYKRYGHHGFCISTLEKELPYEEVKHIMD